MKSNHKVIKVSWKPSDLSQRTILENAKVLDDLAESARKVLVKNDKKINT